MSLRSRVSAFIVAAGLWAFGAAGVASAAEWYWYTHPDQLSSGQTYWPTDYYVFDGHALEGHGQNGARSGVWFVNSAGNRTSADKYCETVGCTVLLSWSGSYPTGYPAIHHHGMGANPDLFDGRVYDNR
jgi:hypothetical protein